jgi:hypothetical protein
LFQRIFLAVFVLSTLALLRAQTPPESGPGKPLPPGPMQAKVKAACTQCHKATRITEQHLTRRQWSVELDKMEGLGAVIPESDRSAFLNYLTKNFGSEKGASKSAAKKNENAAD